MADTKLTALTAITLPVDEDDIVYVVDDPGGSPLSKKITVSNFMAQPFAQIYVTGGTGSQTLVASTWTKITQFTVNGESLRCTADQTNNRVTVTETGKYRVFFQASFESDTGNTTFDLQIRWNAAQQNQIHCQRKIGSGGDVGSCSAEGYIDVTVASTDVELWVLADGGASFEAIEMQLNVERVAYT